jgi:hypothetical protein
MTFYRDDCCGLGPPTIEDINDLFVASGKPHGNKTTSSFS